MIAIAGLAFLVLIHEAGHFFASLAVGMRPRKFYVGFPPVLAKVTRNGIEYGLGAIPFGGYVRIPGMHRPAAKDVDHVFSRALHDAPELIGPAERLKRALAAEAYDTAKIRLAEFKQRAEELGVTSADKHIVDLEDALSPQAYWRAPTWKRVVAIAAGPVTNLVFAVVLFACVFMVAGWSATTKVAVVLHKSQAAAAGLKSGDQVIEINGSPVTANQISDRINSSRGRPVTLTVVTPGGQVTTLKPERPIKDSDGRYRLGFGLAGQPLSVGPAIWQSIKTTGYVARDTGKALGGIFQSKGRGQIGGPVGIGRTAADAVHYGWASYLSVLAFISLSLALFNLLPLLPLDGGHIAFALLEGIRGRAIAREIYERVSAVGITIVLLLFIVGLSNDVGRLGGG
ncbi:MAG TPA: M50 family metallopeptidase [Gaiellaceae bacterium]|nr:M50 family metallopeptidase [Gaiellaceae bacterium]